MNRSRVVVLYAHPLFGEGIAKLLAKDQRLEVHCGPARRQEVIQKAAEMQPDALILEGYGGAGEVDHLVEDLPPIPVTFVDMRDAELVAYRNRHLVSPAPLTLDEAIRPS